MVMQTINNFWDVSVLQIKGVHFFSYFLLLCLFGSMHLFLNLTWYLRCADVTTIMYFHDQQDL